MEKSYYEILQVEKDADERTIKKAWQKACLKYHPDKLPENQREEGEKMFKTIKEAYEVLSDPTKRQIYDRFGKAGLDQQSMDMVNINHIEVPIQITLENIYNNEEIEIKFHRKSVCTKCDGNGTADGLMHNCTVCNGTGYQFIRQGMFAMQSTCNSCRGQGYALNTKLCLVCGGKKRVKELHKMKIRVPREITSKMAMLIQHEGDEVKDHPRGHVILKFELLPHNIFNKYKNSKYDLVAKINIPLEDALCGINTTLKHLDGRLLSIIYDGTLSDGETKVIKNEGLYNAKQDHNGDLYIKFKVTYPKNLTSKHKENIYKAITNKPYKKLDINPPDGSYPVALSVPVKSDNNNNNRSNHQNFQQSFRVNGQQCPVQ